MPLLCGLVGVWPSTSPAETPRPPPGVGRPAARQAIAQGARAAAVYDVLPRRLLDALAARRLGRRVARAARRVGARVAACAPEGRAPSWAGAPWWAAAVSTDQARRAVVGASALCWAPTWRLGAHLRRSGAVVGTCDAQAPWSSVLSSCQSSSVPLRTQQAAPARRTSHLLPAWP